MDKNIIKRQSVIRKKLRVRKKITGSAERPRLSIFRSERHIYGQIIDDESGRTLLAVSSIGKDLRGVCTELKPAEVATKVGETLAERALAAGVQKVVFDRNGRKYGGRVKTLADAARSKGLQF